MQPEVSKRLSESEPSARRPLREGAAHGPPSPGKHSRSEVRGSEPPTQLSWDSKATWTWDLKENILQDQRLRANRKLARHSRNSTSRHEATKDVHLPSKITTFPQSKLPPLTSASCVLRPKVPGLPAKRLAEAAFRNPAEGECPEQWAGRDWATGLRVPAEALRWDRVSLEGSANSFHCI